MHDHWHPLLPNFPHPAESEGPGHLRLIFEEAFPTRGGYPPLPCEDNIPLSHAKVTSPLSCQNNILEDNKLEEVLGGRQKGGEREGVGGEVCEGVLLKGISIGEMRRRK